MSVQAFMEHLGVASFDCAAVNPDFHGTFEARTCPHVVAEPSQTENLSLSQAFGATGHACIHTYVVHAHPPLQSPRRTIFDIMFM